MTEKDEASGVDPMPDDPPHDDPPHDDSGAGGDAVRAVRQTLTETADAILEAVKSYAWPHVVRLERHILLRVGGLSLALLATVWGAIALTLAAAQILPLWASYLCVSAILAVGAASAFIISSPDNGNRISGSKTDLEGGK